MLLTQILEKGKDDKTLVRSACNPVITGIIENNLPSVNDYEPGYWLKVPNDMDSRDLILVGIRKWKVPFHFLLSPV